jgi:hypothetical protein
MMMNDSAMTFSPLRRYTKADGLFLSCLHWCTTQHTITTLCAQSCCLGQCRATHPTSASIHINYTLKHTTDECVKACHMDSQPPVALIMLRLTILKFFGFDSSIVGRKSPGFFSESRTDHIY